MRLQPLKIMLCDRVPASLSQYPRIILTEESFREEMRNLLLETVKEIQGVLRRHDNLPATKARLIDLILKYGTGEKAKSAE